ncbi:MAG: hypothetical protein H6R17_573 [Proteobacteria bacterium]|nr:hypothetical protein [Pseudomonadota bacterium]
MKTSMKFKSITLIALLAAAVAAPVLAQGGPGMGGGMGYGRGGGPCVQNGGPGAGGPGMGPGGRGGRAMMSNQDNTRGWSLMTPAERTAFQKQMREVKTYDECIAVQTEHRGAMEVRAKEQGTTLPTPRWNACDNLKARGLIK